MFKNDYFQKVLFVHGKKKSLLKSVFYISLTNLGIFQTGFWFRVGGGEADSFVDAIEYLQTRWVPAVGQVSGVDLRAEVYTLNICCV